MKSRYMPSIYIGITACTLIFPQSAVANFNAELRDRIEQYTPADLSDTTHQRMRMMQFLNEYHTDTSIELRPEISEDSISSALRFITGQHANRPAIQKALITLSEIEHLRRNAYLFEEQIYCYRLLLQYKTLEEIITLHQEEKTVFESYLERAKKAFDKNQLSEIEWAKANTALLDISASINALLEERTELKKELRLRLGADAPLATWAHSVRINTMVDKKAPLFLETALENRADYLLLQKRKYLAQLHHETLLAENQFHIQHIQPEIEHDLEDHSITYAVSASFHLPWSSTHTKSMTFRYEIQYYQELIEKVKKRIASEIDVHLLHYHEQYDLNKAYEPVVIDTLEEKWNTLATAKLLRVDQFRDIFYLRSRILKYKTADLERALREQEYHLDLLETCGITP